MGIMFAANLTLGIFLPFHISFPLSLVVFFLILLYILKNNKIGDPFSYSYSRNYNKVAFICVACGASHNRQRCPKCGSNIKKPSFSLAFSSTIAITKYFQQNGNGLSPANQPCFY